MSRWASEVEERVVVKSLKFHKRAMKVIPGGAQTLSKMYGRFIQGVSPAFISHGYKGHIIDVDGNEYVDWSGALGPVVLGYGDWCLRSEFTRLRAECERKTASIPLPTRFEVELAEKLVDIIPCAEMVRFFKNGSDATSAAVRLAKATTGREGVVCCYDDKTEILTSQGFKLFKHLSNNEEVATLNQESGYIEYYKIDKKVRFHFNGYMIHFKSKRTDLMVTPEHDIYRRFTRKNGCHYFKTMKASELIGRVAPVKMTSIGKWNGCNEEFFNIPKLYQSRPTKGIVSFKMEDFVCFMGWYLSEGSCIVQSRGRYEVVISQDVKNEEYNKEIFLLIKRMGFKPSRNGHHISFNSKELVSYLKSFGGCKEKYVPKWIKNLSPKYLTIFVDAIIKGDGTIENGKLRRFYSSNERLIDDVQEILFKLGISTTKTGYSGLGFSKEMVYRLNIANVRKITDSKVKLAPYKGYVYCVNVKNHIVLVRRNGKIVWSGNSGFHGWHDWYASTLPRPRCKGVFYSDWVRKVEYGDLVTLENWLEMNPACFILEPMSRACPELASTEYLQKVRKLCDKHKVVLIFDEIIMGFRYRMAGGQEMYKAIPDLATYAKAMSNGFPIAALVGTRDLMKELEFLQVSGTYFGEVISIAAALDTIEFMENHGVIDKLWKVGKQLSPTIRKMIDKYNLKDIVYLKGGGPWSSFVWKKGRGVEQHYFLQEVVKRGIFYNRDHFAMFTHTDRDVEKTLMVYEEVFSELDHMSKSGIDIKTKLEGQGVSSDLFPV